MKDIFPYYSIGDFINQPESKTTFAITRFENMTEPEVDDIHKHTFYEILWVDEGKGQQTIDYRQYELGTQSLFFISPGQVHEFEEWQPLKGGTILFADTFLLLDQPNKNYLFELSFLDNVYAEPNLQPSPSDFLEIRHTIEWLLKEYERPKSETLILQSLLQVLLLQIQRSIDQEHPPHFPNRYLIVFKQFESLLEKYFKALHPSSFYASVLNMTSHHLNRIVKSVTGKTTSEIIRARSMLEAKRWLSFSEYSVSEIAAELGYLDSSYFARLFKKEVGKNPLAFREEMYEKYRNKPLKS